MKGEGPLGSEIKQCALDSSAQEDKSLPFPLDPEFRVYPPDDGSSPEPTPTPPTTIVVLSLSQSDESTQSSLREFQTPPEHSHSLQSSEEQRPAPVFVDACEGPKRGGEGCGFSGDGVTDGDKAVDLSKDSDTVGFSEPKFVPEIHGAVHGNPDSRSGLGKYPPLECESSGSISKKSSSLEETLSMSDTVPIASRNKEIGRSGLGKGQLLECESSESILKKSSAFEENLSMTDNVSIVIENEEFAEPQVIDIEMDRVCSEQVEGCKSDGGDFDLNLREPDENVRVRKGKKRQQNVGGGSASKTDAMSDIIAGEQGKADANVKFNKCKEEHRRGKLRSGTKNIEDIDKFGYVGNSDAEVTKDGGRISASKTNLGTDTVDGFASGKLVMPLSSVRADEQADEGSEDAVAKDVNVIDDVANVAKVKSGVGADCKDGDFFETAKKCGLNFPRPRWWPPEGLDD